MDKVADSTSYEDFLSFGYGYGVFLAQMFHGEVKNMKF